MNNAIKLAIEKGGYETDWFSKNKRGEYVNNTPGEQITILDPLFWKSLGKVLGWKECLLCSKPELKLPCVCEWQNRAHDYLDHSFNGTTEKFWKGLIN